MEDAQHIFEAQKYGSYFVTTDKRLLSRAVAIRSACTVNVLRPSEFLSLVKQYINQQQDVNTDYRPLRDQLPPIRPEQNAPKMNTIAYKGYIIHAVPYKLADSGKWTIDIDIMRDDGNKINIQHFSAENTLKTKEEAIYHCIRFGQQVIDGKFENCAVRDL